jgi:hypothetical protein
MLLRYGDQQCQLRHLRRSLAERNRFAGPAAGVVPRDGGQCRDSFDMRDCGCGRVLHSRERRRDLRGRAGGAMRRHLIRRHLGELLRRLHKCAALRGYPCGR